MKQNILRWGVVRVLGIPIQNQQFFSGSAFFKHHFSSCRYDFDSPSSSKFSWRKIMKSSENWKSHSLLWEKRRQVNALSLHSLKLTAWTCQMKPFPKNESVVSHASIFRCLWLLGFMEMLICFFFHLATYQIRQLHLCLVFSAKSIGSKSSQNRTCKSPTIEPLWDSINRYTTEK